MMSKKLTCHAKSKVNRNEVIENQFLVTLTCSIVTSHKHNHAGDVKNHFACHFELEQKRVQIFAQILEIHDIINDCNSL